MVKEFFADDVSCGSISTGMRSLSQATVDGSRCVVNESILAGVLPNIYRQNSNNSFKIISLAGILSSDHQLAGGKVPDRITVERKNTQAGVEVKVALCNGSVALRGETLLLEPGNIAGESLYHSRIVEGLNSSAGDLFQASEVTAVVKNGKFLDDETHKLNVNFQLLPDVIQLDAGVISNTNLAKKYPYGVIRAVYDSNTKAFKGASGYGLMSMKPSILPHTLGLSELELNFRNSDSSSGANVGNQPSVSELDLILSSLKVGAKIFVDEKVSLTQQDCMPEAKFESDSLNLFDYFFTRTVGVGKTNPLVWVPTEGAKERNFKSACMQMAKYATQDAIRSDAKDLNVELMQFNCGGDQQADVLPAVAAPWVENCMVKAPSTVFACAEDKAGAYREAATDALNQLLKDSMVGSSL